MDTKLKKSSRKRFAVIIAFLLCVSSFTAAATIGITELLRSAQWGNPFDILTSKTYEGSGGLQDEFMTKYNSLYWARSNGEEHDLEGMVSNFTEQGITFYIVEGAAVLTNLGEQASELLTAEELQNLGHSQGAYRLFENGKLTGEPKVSPGFVSADRRLINQITDFGYGSRSDERVGDEVSIVYMAFTEKYVNDARESFDSMREELVAGGALTLVSALLALISFIAVCVLCGKKDELGRPVLTGMDRWFTELIIGAMAFCAVLVCLVCVAVSNHYFSYEYYNYYAYTNDYLDRSMLDGIQIAATAAGFWITSAASLFFLLSLVKKAKAGRFFRDFLIVKIFTWIWSGLRDIYYGSSVMKKVIIMVGLMCVCSATIVFFPVVLVVSLVFCAKWVKQYEAIKEGVREVKNGNSAYKIFVEGEPQGELQQLASDINAISEGFDVAVKQELKNQRMKTELISNVSHDIKTPLTSIITYVDLLKKEGLDCEDASKYLDVLDQKSIRLKKLTEDLFEAAKASSGDIPVSMGRVELVSLLNQTLGELDDRLASRGLEVIVKADSEKYTVEADGQLMWRVLENLFGNAVKYALENSRVYVDLRQEHRESEGRTVAVLEMKNVSRNPLNIPADELMERFKRGDESRSTEGSGLGLAIARDLMRIQRGTFDIIIDGDLFKAVLAWEVCQ